MINYVWAGLIIIAVFFGAFMELLGDPPATEPKKKMIERFEGVETVVDLPTSSDDFFVKESDRGKVQGSSGELAYDLTDSNTASFPVNFAIESSVPTENFNGDQMEAKPNAITMRLKGDGSSHSLRAMFTDADGDRYVTTVADSFSRDEWRPVTIELSSLVSEEYDALESLDFPVTMNELLIVRNADSETETGRVYIDDMEFEFPYSYKVGESVQSNSWMGVLTAATTRWAEISIDLALGLVGIMMLWLGLMRIAEKAGLVQVLARLVKPIMTRLFPNIPPEGEAMGAILMNVSANMLGLGNAATPLGLKAMEELQKVNENKEYASNAMCMLLAVNTSSVTIIPATVFAFRAGAGSTEIMKFWPIMILTTLFSTICAITACKILEKFPIFKIPPPKATEEGPIKSEEGGNA